jgi:hypothetical protein
MLATMIILKRLAGVTTSVALALAGTAALAAPAAAAPEQFAHLKITKSLTTPNHYVVQVYGRVNIPGHQNVTVHMRLKGDDTIGDDDLDITGSAPAVRTIEDPAGTGSFSISGEVPRSALDEDPFPGDDDEIYAWVSASTGWTGLTENRYLSS